MTTTNCPDCGKNVSDKAESCPNCGRVLKKKEGCLAGLLKIGLIIFALFIINDVYKTYSNTSNNQSQNSTKIEKLDEFSTKEIDKLFSNNTVRAKSIFKDKYIVIKGVYNSMRENTFTENIVVVYLNNDVVCIFRNNNINSLSKLNKGDHIKVKGKYTGKSFKYTGKKLMGRTFDGCEIMP